jgi:hypothetical protein
MTSKKRSRPDAAAGLEGTRMRDKNPSPLFTRPIREVHHSRQGTNKPFTSYEYSSSRGGRSFYYLALVLLFTVAVQAQQFGEKDDSSSYSYSSMFQQQPDDESLPFDRGGTRPRCWNATGLQTLSENNNNNNGSDSSSSSSRSRQMYLAAELDFKDTCTPETQLLVQVIDTPDDYYGTTATLNRRWSETASVKQRLTATGWEVSSDHELKLLVLGTWGGSGAAAALEESSSKAALVIQLCPVGMNSQCPPIIPSPPYQNDNDNDNEAASSPFTRRRALQTTTSANNNYKEEDLLGTVVDFVFPASFGQEDGGAFSGELSLSGIPVGTYSLLGSVVIFGPNLQFDGASITPMASSNNNNKEQLITVFQDDSVAGEEPYSVHDWSVKCVISLCVIGGIIVLFLLIQFYRQRKSQVFELTQGKFILAMLFSGLFATCSLVLVEHKNDVYCHLYQPFVTLPMHIMFAILVGRMWRIRAIISPLLLLTLEKKENWTTKFVNIIEWITRLEGLGERVKTRDKKIRRTITDGQLMRVIVLLCFPQVIVQILILTIGDQGFSNTAGYETCKETYFNSPLGILSFTFLLGLFVTLLVLAGTSRNLPSLFNETRSMLDVAVTALRMTCLGAILIVATHTYPSATTVQYLVFAFLAGVTIVHTCIRITWPKLAMAQSGGRIVVTKLIAAHNEERRISKSVRPRNSAVSAGSSSYNSEFYGGPMLTGISLPTQRSTMTASTSRWQSNGSKAIAEAPSSPMESPDMLDDTMIKTNLSPLQEEDGESSGSMRALKEGRNRKEEPSKTDPASDGEEEENEDEEDAQSTDSSVVLIGESELKERVSGASLFSTGTYPPRRMRTQNGLSSTSLSSSSASNSRNTSIVSFGWNTSEATLGARLANASPGVSGPDGGGTRPSNVRVLSRRTLFQRDVTQGKRSLNPLNPDIENPPTGGQAPTRPISRHTTGTYKKMSIMNLLRRQVSVRGNGGSKSFTTGMAQTQPMVPLAIEYNPKRKPGKIRVAEDEPPPRRLLLRMIDVQRMLGKANNTILAGLCVDIQDWEEIFEACVALGDVFENEVEFAWKRYLQDEDNHINENFEGKMEENMPEPTFGRHSSGPPNLSHPGGRGLMMKKQLSWKPGLIEPSAESHSEESAALPSILRNFSSRDMAGSTEIVFEEDEEDGPVLSLIDDDGEEDGQLQDSVVGPMKKYAESVETNDESQHEKVTPTRFVPSRLSQGLRSMPLPERKISEQNLQIEVDETQDDIAAVGSASLKETVVGSHKEAEEEIGDTGSPRAATDSA